MVFPSSGKKRIKAFFRLSPFKFRNGAFFVWKMDSLKSFFEAGVGKKIVHGVKKKFKIPAVWGKNFLKY